MTINESQGQSLLCVRLSRCGNPDHLRVAFDGNGVRNAVIKKVLAGNV